MPSVGDGLFDTIFSGQNGLASMLLGMFGGTATICYMEKQSSFNDETGETVPAEWSYEQIACGPEKNTDRIIRSQFDANMNDGDIAVYLDFANMKRPIIAETDKLKWSGKTWDIIEYDNMMSGNEIAALRVILRESFDGSV